MFEHKRCETSRKSLRVLIADDTPAIRTSLSALISRLDDVSVVGLAETGTQAFELACALQPDVMTLDIRMPGASGLNVLEWLRQNHLPVKTIILSGLDGEEYREKCLQLGASHFFDKSAEFEKLIRVLKEMAEGLNSAEELD